MIDSLLSVTVAQYDQNIWVPVVLAFIGLAGAVVKVLVNSQQNSGQLTQIHTMVNGNLTTAVNEIARLRTILESGYTPAIPTQPAHPVELVTESVTTIPPPTP